MPLLENGRPIADHWTSIADTEALPAGPAIITGPRWLAERTRLMAERREIGIALANDARVEDFAADVARFGVIALAFPKYTDGRAYSQARLLRERYGFRGELRATGNILPDQLAFMRRCGFSTFETDDPRVPAAWEAAMTRFSVHFQPAGVQPAPGALWRHARTG